MILSTAVHLPVQLIQGDTVTVQPVNWMPASFKAQMACHRQKVTQLICRYHLTDAALSPLPLRQTTPIAETIRTALVSARNPSNHLRRETTAPPPPDALPEGQSWTIKLT